MILNPLRVVVYGAWLAGETLRGALQISADVLTPGLKMSPAIVELRLHCETDLEISTFASSITITPGTISLGIAPRTGDSPPTLYVHALYGQDAQEVVSGLRHMEHRMLTMTRGKAKADEAMEVAP